MSTTTRKESVTKGRFVVGRREKKKDLFKNPEVIAARKKIWSDPSYDFTKPTLPVE